MTNPKSVDSPILQTPIPPSCCDDGTIDMPSAGGLEFEAFQVELPEQAQSFEDRYMLHDQIGQGGIGTVWRAEQLAPVKREVAIKFLRLECPSASAMARFAMEHQALAMMSHPHIATVFDGGIFERSPYIVLELVKGMTLTEHCDQRKCTIADRLRLFCKVCTAIEHAHQRGIIHRDLKPSNVLVREDGNTATPKVIDFGLAKALPWADCGEAMLNTSPGVAIGTPAYMSPEQIDHKQPIDTRTDVYALGVMLYELAAGEVPFTAINTNRESWVDTFQKILNERPESPSSLLSQSLRRTEIAAARGAEAKQVVRAVKGDLDSIILKALEKSSEMRYQGVAELRQDVERLLSHRPIEARPFSVGYQLARFARRHAFAVSVASLAAFTLLASSLVMAWALVRARVAEAEARTALQAELRAKERNTIAMKALAEALVGGRSIDDDRDDPLLQHVLALHDVATDHVASHHPTDGFSGEQMKGSRQEVTIRRALDVLQHLRSERPEPLFRIIEAKQRARLASLLEAKGESRSAEREYRQSVKQLSVLAREQPAASAIADDLAQVSERLRKLQLRLSECSEEARQPSPTGPADSEFR